MQAAFIIVISVATLILVIFILRQNKKDQQNLTQQLNRDYRAKKEEEGDIDIDEIRH